MGAIILHLCIAYVAFICQSKSYWFIKKRNPSKPITSNSGLTIPIRVQFELFFLNECPNGFVLLKSDAVGIRLKKIASYGVWGNGRFPQLNFPSALAVAKQVCSFLFAYWDVDFYFVVVANKKLHSCGLFLVLWVYKIALTVIPLNLISNFINLQKQCKYFPSALAEARSKGILFYLLTANVLIGFLGCLMRNSQ